jgi:O-antigen/teichoic acid export membrane protein
VIVLAFQTDRFWVSSHSGLKAVSVYGLVSTMFNHIHMIFIAMAAWMMPRLSAMTSRGDNPTKLYTQVRNALLTAIVVALLCLHVLSPFIFSLWVGKEMYAQMAGYLKAFIVFELVFAHTIMPFFYLNASGRERTATMLTFLYCGMSYACMLGGLYFFGDAAYMVLGMALAMAVTMPVANYVTARRMGNEVSAGEVIAEMLPMYLACALVYAPAPWMGPVLLALIVLTLWRSYVADLIKTGLWRRLVKA